MFTPHPPFLNHSHESLFSSSAILAFVLPVQAKLLWPALPVGTAHGLAKIKQLLKPVKQWGRGKV